MLVAGIMSGTSVDGIDVALVRIEGAGFEMSVEPVAFHSTEFRAEVRRAILAVSDTQTHTAQISQMHFLLGDLLGEAVVEACRAADLPLDELDLVGSHGQTIYHQPAASTVAGRGVRSTLQIGEAALIAERTGTPVVADFRPSDMAAGGQGAPLAPYVDYLLFRDREMGRVVLNIGGIANITAIPAAARPEEVIAFDTGPGNMIMDALASHFSGGASKFDDDGKLAASGRADGRLVEKLAGAAYFQQSPPKSTGREEFGVKFVEDLLKENLEPADLMATANAFSATTIARAIEQFLPPAMKARQLIASGGGTRNGELMRQLGELLPGVEIRPSDEFGVASDAKEAIAFAVLAYETFHRRPANLPSATGARHPAILGKLVWPFPPPETASASGENRHPPRSA